jgi:diguanylate cyclase (GGDEF)-like protein/PAS domain S-box-containing protein
MPKAETAAMPQWPVRRFVAAEPFGAARGVPVDCDIPAGFDFSRKQNAKMLRNQRFGLTYSCVFSAHIAVERSARRHAMPDEKATPLNGDDVWQHALSTARLGVIDRNFETGAISHSPSWKRMLGYEEHELPDHEGLWLSLMHPDDIEAVREVSRRNVVGETPHLEAEFRLRHKDGDWRWFIGRGCVVERDPATGAAVRMIALQTDITDQKLAEHALLHTNERLRLALNASGIGIWHYEPETDTLSWDERMHEIYGIASGSAAVTRRLWADSLHPEDRAGIEALNDTAIRGGETVEFRYRIVTPSGEIRHIMALMKLVEDEKRPKRLVGTNRDVTSEVLAAEALATEKETLRVTLHSIRDAVVATSGEGVITYVNEAAEQLFGCAESEMIGRPIAIWLNKRCTGRLEEGPDTLLALSGPDDSERLIRHTAAPIVTGTSAASGSVHTFQDVTEEQARKRELAHAARHDSLTGALNRGAFEDVLARTITDEMATPFALLYIDIDYFKAINDMAGHAAGDNVLIGASAAMGRCLPAEAVIGRLGGDEFAVIVPAPDRDRAVSIAECMLNSIRSTPVPAGLHHRGMGASIGVEFVSEPGGTATDILARADDACYAAKAGGRNRVALRQKRSETSGGLAAIRMASDIGDAMEDGRLHLYGQEVRLLGNPWRSAGVVEVLARLTDAHGNNVPPSEFIPAAERFGMAAMLDRWVIREAVERYGSAMGANGRISLGFNLSAQTLSDPSLWSFVEETLRRNGASPEQVIFEITETATVTNFAAAESFVHSAREAGCRVSLDDFGAGLSSFGYLRRFTVDSVKIDGEFVENIAQNDFDRAIVASISGIARDLGIHVVAERIEDPEALAVLQGLGVKYVQGFLLHRPEPLRAVVGRICGGDDAVPDIENRQAG